MNAMRTAHADLLARYNAAAAAADAAAAGAGYAASAVHEGPAEAADTGLKGFRPKQPKAFSGDDPAVDVHAFVFAVGAYLHTCNFQHEATKLSLMPSLLTGSAATWWMFTCSGRMGDAPDSWAGVSAALITRFQPINAADKARDAFMTVRQKTSVQLYVQEFQAIMQYLPDTEEADSLHRFIHGLKPELQRAIKAQPPQSLRATINAADRLCHIQSSGSSHSSSSFKPRLLQPEAFSVPASTSGPTPMELGHLGEEPDWDDISWEGRSQYLYEEDYETVSAIMQTRRAPLPRTGKAPFGPGNPLSQLQQDKAQANALCFSCLSSSHSWRDCPLRRPKGRTSPA